jgi:hypothetical protein
MIAAGGNNSEAVSLLLAAGADSNATRRLDVRAAKKTNQAEDAYLA